MTISRAPAGWEDKECDPGCAYIHDDGDRRWTCGAPRKVISQSRKQVSPYCHEHHALCRVPYGSEAEAGRLREVEALAEVVGGRRGRDAVGPSRRFLRRLEQAARVISRPDRS
jgi:hypothetical protein